VATKPLLLLDRPHHREVIRPACEQRCGYCTVEGLVTVCRSQRVAERCRNYGK